jgi:hypothetical protein
MEAAGPEQVIPELVVRGRRSVGDVAAIVYDSGVQLGAGCLREEAGPVAARMEGAWSSIKGAGPLV